MIEGGIYLEKDYPYLGRCNILVVVKQGITHVLGIKINFPSDITISRDLIIDFLKTHEIDDYRISLYSEYNTNIVNNGYLGKVTDKLMKGKLIPYVYEDDLFWE